MTDALEDHFGRASIGDRPITNLRFTNHIDRLAVNNCKLASLVEQLTTTLTNLSIEITAEKTKIVTNSKSH